MITREQYLEALDIVETYHQQIRQKSAGRSSVLKQIEIIRRTHSEQIQKQADLGYFI